MSGSSHSRRISTACSCGCAAASRSSPKWPIPAPPGLRRRGAKILRLDRVTGGPCLRPRLGSCLRRLRRKARGPRRPPTCPTWASRPAIAWARASAPIAGRSTIAAARGAPNPCPTSRARGRAAMRPTGPNAATARTIRRSSGSCAKWRKTAPPTPPHRTSRAMPRRSKACSSKPSAPGSRNGGC